MSNIDMSITNTPGLHHKISVFSDPDPGKSYPLPMKKTISEQPRPWRKSCERESCYGDRVYYYCITIIAVIKVNLTIITSIKLIISYYD